MAIIAYYEGSDVTRDWLRSLLAVDIEFKKLPVSNDSKDFTKLPAYVADILFLDKPDVIISGCTDGVHERPIFSIEFASCTPQYQHALQRFSRMVASVTSGCPSALIIPKHKRENSGGDRLYVRSKAVEYGAVKLMDIYSIPAFIFDWPDADGVLINDQNFVGLPPIHSESMQNLSKLLKQAIQSFNSVNYVQSLMKTQMVGSLIEAGRTSAYQFGPPTIVRPGGGESDSGGSARLDLLNTAEMIASLNQSMRVAPKILEQLPEFVTNREKSLVFYPTRVVEHAGDPYVGMIAYYDIAFCRNGPTERDRNYNLVAWCRGVSISEVRISMERYNQQSCPFTTDITSANVLKYSYHLKYGCRSTKVKPVRIYSELADLMIFDDGILFNVG